MKTTLHLTIATFALAVFTLSTVVVRAEYKYATTNGTITITGYTGPHGAVDIPDTLNGLPVTSIGDRAFNGNGYLTSSVTIPGSVTNIGRGAFGNCYSLACVTIPNSVASIGSGAFSGCNSLVRVSIPDSVIRIEAYTFYNCTSLTNVTIGSSVTSIGDYALSGCTSLSNVRIPNSVVSIGETAFIDCGSLTAITVDASNSAYSSVDGVLFNKSQTTLIQCPEGKAGRYAVPDDVTSIGYAAFYLCHMLTSVTIPSNVNRIDDWAFYDSSLMAVCFQGNAPSVGSYVFGDAVTVYYLPGATGWGPTFGDRPTGLWSSEVPCTYELANSAVTLTLYTGSGGMVTIPSTINGLPVTSIGNSAFAGCTNLTSVTLPNSVTSIGLGAFAGCTSLANVTIPNGVISIGGGAFFGCTSLSSVTIPKSVTVLNEGAFTMWHYTFGRCTNLTSVNFQGNAPILDSRVFDGYVNATVYYLPGTMGWGSTFGDRPTALWVLPYPIILTIVPSFGVQSNCLGFVISWATNASVVVEACTSLTSPVWISVSTNTLSNGWSYFRDAQWTNYPGRFYRVREQ